jgi:hypothetical protein
VNEETGLPDLAKSRAEHLAATVLPAGGIVWTAAEIMHLTGQPGTLASSLAGIALTALAWGASVKHEGIGWLPWWAGAGAVLLAAADKIGPLAWWPAPVLTGAWAVATLIARRRAFAHDAVTEARDWRDQRAGWLQVRNQWGFGGTHLIGFEETRLGERYTVKTRGSGKLASSFLGRGHEELIAEDLGLPPSRVSISRPSLAGQVIISVRRLDPWAKPDFHPAVDPDSETVLPDVRTIRTPAQVGADPETGRPLLVPLCDEAGGKNVSVVGQKGAGKDVLADSLAEHVTACYDALLVWIDLSVKGHLAADSWGPSCLLTALGPHNGARAVKVLQAVSKIIEWRAMTYKRGQYAPSARDPQIVVVFNEADSAMASPGVRKQADDLATKGRELGVSSARLAQRGTTDYSSAKARSQDDVFAVGKVNRQGEVYHAAGSAGFTLPDMAGYGEGKPGVWAVALLGEGHSTGRTWIFGRTPAAHGAAVEQLAADRAFTRPALHPDCEAFLGDDFQVLLGTDVFATFAQRQGGETDGDREDAPAAPSPARDDDPAASPEPVRATVAVAEEDPLERAWEMNVDEDTQARIAGIHAKLDAARQVMAETAALPKRAPLSPEGLEARAALTAERWRQVGEQAQIPDDARPRLLAMLGEGTTISAIADGFGLKRWTARTWLEALRNERLAYVDGERRGARWRLAPPPEGGDAQ